VATSAEIASPAAVHAIAVAATAAPISSVGEPISTASDGPGRIRRTSATRRADWAAVMPANTVSFAAR